MKPPDEAEIPQRGAHPLPSSEVEEGASEAGGGEIPEDAIFNPDDPIARPEGEIPEDAIFSPDEPIVRREPGASPGVVTGVGSAGVRRKPWEGDLAWQIRRTSHLLESLAHALREQGLEALRVHPETDPMDAMLRAFVAGYLVGRLDIRE